jgi:hypothetical protein
MKTLSGHQPNFMPWLGYFYKIAKSDVFVFSDHLQYSPKNWINRVNIKTKNKNEALITIPVSCKSDSLIKDVLIANQINWRSKLVRTIEDAYRKQPHYSDIHPIIDFFTNSEEILLSEFNINLTSNILNKLEIKTELILGSTLDLEIGKSNHIVDACLKLNCKHYLAGNGTDYHDYELFNNNHIHVKKVNFKHPIYRQSNLEFTPGLSIIDAIANIGLAGVSELFFNEYRLENEYQNC